MPDKPEEKSVKEPEVRPPLLGYMRIDPDTTAVRVRQLRRSIAEFAEQEGFRLAEVFVESPTTATSAFAALTDTLQRTDARTVVVPTLQHFAHLASVRTAMKELLERQFGAQVLVIHPDPEKRP